MTHIPGNLLVHSGLGGGCFRENAFYFIHVIWQQSPLLFSLSSSSCQSSLRTFYRLLS